MSSFFILRECLWRVPVAFTAMVEKEEKNRINQERCCKVFSYCLNLNEKRKNIIVFLSSSPTQVLIFPQLLQERGTLAKEREYLGQEVLQLMNFLFLKLLMLDSSHSNTLMLRSLWKSTSRQEFLKTLTIFYNLVRKEDNAYLIYLYSTHN